MPKSRRAALRKRISKNDDAIPRDCKLRYTPGLAGTRRNPGKEDGLIWNGSSFLSPANVDGVYHDDASEDDVEDEILQQIIDRITLAESEERGPISVSLVDIARPEKVRAKGVAREFELIKTPRRVIVLEEEDPSSLTDEDDWESLFAEEAPRKERRPYSAVLRGNDQR